MVNLLRRFRSDSNGQDLAEYGIALGVIAIGVGLVAVAIANDVNNIWTTAQTAIASAI